MATVSNPYTFTISANKTVSCVISSALPAEETSLAVGYTKFDFSPGDYVTEEYTIVIPPSVNVIKWVYHMHATTGKSSDSEWYKDSENGTYKIIPYSGSFYSGNTYLSVTPGKTYWIKVDIYAEGDEGYLEMDFLYSKEINNHAADASL